jgi:hypothetical protein
LKKVPLLITLGIVSLIIVGYYTYKKIIVKDPVRAWDLVSSDAIIVYERENCESCVDQLRNSTLWNIIERAAFYNEPVDSVRNKISMLLKNNQQFLVSVHTTKKDDFDFVYYLPNVKTISGLVLPNTGAFKTTARQFNTVTIHEIKSPNQVFSYATIGEIWIGSFTPFLIEDVIRTHTTGSKIGFKQSGISNQGFSTIKDDAGNLYIHLKNLGDLLNAFTADRTNADYSYGKSAILDIKSAEKSLTLNGFSMDSAEYSRYLLSIFHHQAPVSFGLKHLISNRAIAVCSYGVSDGAAFGKDLSQFVKKRKPQLQDTLQKLSTRHRFELDNLYTLISEEFGVCFLESSKGKRLSKILLIETKEPQKWLTTFNKISEKLSIDTIFYERYSQYEIREVPLFRFPEKLLWPMVSGFEQSFYTSIGNVILIGDNVEELKNYLDDIDAEDVWGKSVGQNRFLESTLLESNVNLYFNTAKALNVLSGSLQPRWQNFVHDNQSLLQSLQMSSVQFSHLNNNFYTNALFTYRSVTSPIASVATKEKLSINFDQGIYKLHTVKSHVNRNDEVLIQDSLNDLTLISAEGKALWKLPVGDRITSDVVQVDFFNNGKLQYFFASRNTVHIIDRLGNYVDPYPLHVPVEIDYVTVIDYDNSKKYRILIADKKGKLWMYDKEGNNLEGWKPKDVGGSLAMQPRHHRIKGKDYILAVRKDGQVFLMNRRGENLRKFPLNSESIPSGSYSLERGSALSDTYFVLISQEGFRIKFNMEGKVLSRENLPKTSVHSVFSLVGEKSFKSYLVLQQDGRQLSLTDENGKVILSNNIKHLNPEDITYFDFGGGKVFIVLTDNSQGLSYVYDGDGNLLTAPPLESNAVDIRPMSSDQFRLYYLHGKSLILQPL